MAVTSINHANTNALATELKYLQEKVLHWCSNMYLTITKHIVFR